MGDLSEHFSLAEFRCRCGACDGYPVRLNGKLVETLETMRRRIDRPITVRSGLRCPAWNAKVGGVDSSAHTAGDAADLAAVTSGERYALVEAAIIAGMRRIGIGKTFVHVDVSQSHAQDVMWLYPSG